MSAETFTTAIFLITAVIAAGVLVTAIFPVISSMSGTFSSNIHESDTRLRTDFKIVATLPTYGTPVPAASTVKVWMKNIGSQRISDTDITKSDVFCGPVGNFGRLTHNVVAPGFNEWTETLSDDNLNGYWDTGETLQITAVVNPMDNSAPGSFQFILPSGIWRSNEFT
jgi:flagellar protein FlaG